ncbi:dihydropteridine reductase-like [Clavelina lepadiformis]|uniref:Dihydropteridine reductase n=1 Tax=Clavelina lepadiformis TaxID=159417 RepID=A0ABP0GAY5_CLALP
MALHVAVYGGSGALGRTIVNFFKSGNHVVTSIDLMPNDSADQNVVIKNTASWPEQHKEVADGMASVLGEKKIDALFCVAGGWAGGNASSKNYIKNCDLMWKQSVWSSTIAGNLATKFLKSDGILTLTGAHPATSGTPGMIGYGLAKAAVHQLCKSFASASSGLPENSCTVCIAPITLDTPMNRKGMPDANFTSWTPLEYLAELFLSWANGENRPDSGSLVKVQTEAGKTTLTTLSM